MSPPRFSSGHVLCVLLSAAAAAASDGTLVRKFQAVSVHASSWGGASSAAPVSTTKKNNFVCAASAVGPPSHLHHAYFFDSDTGECKLGQPTCMRAPDGDGSAELVFVSGLTVSYMGCYASSTPATLPGSTATALPAAKTPEACIRACALSVSGRGGYVGVGNGGSTCRCRTVDDGPPRADRLSAQTEEGECDTPCEDDGSQTCGGISAVSVYKVEGADFAPAWPATPEEKTAWLLTSSPTTWASSKAVDFLRDGDLSTGFKPNSQYYNWLQIELPSSQLVKGMRIVGKQYHLHSHMEARVGDTDAGSTIGNQEKMCANRLCYTTSESEHVVQDFDCAQPLRGKYVTVQKYGNMMYDGWFVYELDLTLLCADTYLSASCDVHAVEPDESCEEDRTDGAAIYLGCFVDDAGDRTLSGMKHGDGDPHPLKCAQACLMHFFAYSGVNADQTCFCDDYPPMASKKADESDCDTDCTSDGGFKCGGTDRLSVYYTSTTIRNVLQDVGCYSLASYGTALGKPYENVGGNDFVRCAASCTSLGFEYSASGGADGEECDCAHAAPTSGLISSDPDDAACSVNCLGSSGYWRKCGAAGHRSIHRMPDINIVTLLSPVTPESSWSLTSSTADASSAVRPASHAIDGLWTTFFLSSEKFAWFQADTGISRLVQAVYLVSRLDADSWAWGNDYAEVRVGDADAAAGLEAGEKICANRLCYTTGMSQTAFKAFLCSSPLRGRYVTVQKYERSFFPDGPDFWQWPLSITRIQIFT